MPSIILVQRLAGTVFLIRVVSAALAFGSQVLLARWMGTFEFGVYVYVWTWVLLIGQAIDFGLGTAAQRFIPEYRERGLLALLRGFISRKPLGGDRPRDRHRRACSRRARCGCSSRGSTSYMRHPALSRLHHAAGLRARPHAGRHRALLRLDRARR